MKSSRAPSPPLRRLAPVPASYDDSVVWATWLYYVDQLTQSEVSEILGVSRATVVSLLQEARERGVVRIDIDTEVASRTTLSHRLIERWGLEQAAVIPGPGGPRLTQRLGEAGARVLSAMIQPGDVIGVAWGKTVLAVAHAIPASSPALPVTVVQVAGSSTGSTPDFSPELCSSLLASRLGARCVNLLAPGVLSTPDLRDRLMAEPSLLKQWAMIRSVNRIVFGVGDLDAGATVREAEMTSDELIDDYQRRGAIAALIGRFVGADGRPVPGDLDRRMIGITPDELKAISVRLCVAGGPRKIAALKAALTGGYATHLVTDAETAIAILES